MFLLKKGFQSIEFPKQSIECDSYLCYNRNTVMAVTTENFDWVKLTVKFNRLNGLFN